MFRSTADTVVHSTPQLVFSEPPYFSPVSCVYWAESLFHFVSSPSFRIQSLFVSSGLEQLFENEAMIKAFINYKFTELKQEATFKLFLICNKVFPPTNLHKEWRSERPHSCHSTSDNDGDDTQITQYYSKSNNDDNELRDQIMTGQKHTNTLYLLSYNKEKQLNFKK